MNTDDPKLTAYALGELTAEELAEIQALVQAQPDLSAEVEATRDLAGRLRLELKAEEEVALSPEQRDQLVAGSHLRVLPEPEPKPYRWSVRLLQVAAVLALLCIVGGLLVPAISTRPGREGFFGGFEVDVAKMKAPANQPAAGPQAEDYVRARQQVPKLAMTEVGTPPPIPSAPASAAAGKEVELLAQRRLRMVADAKLHGGVQLVPAAPSLPVAASASAPRDRFWNNVGEAKDEYAFVPRTATISSAEAYDATTDNAFMTVADHPLSTFSIDVDTASYANVRRFLSTGALPPKGAVRIEEMLNYFPYDYPQPAGDAPFSSTMEVAACPWEPGHRLVRIGLKGKDVARSERPAANLVFLIDVSGSMQPANKLPLVKESLRLLIDQLDDRDLVAIAVYAGASGTVLEPTRDKPVMRAALDRLEAGGSTNGAGGIRLAYDLARRSFIQGGTNRVILATDGDFNVGVTSQSELVDLITEQAKTGVFLSVLGYGMGNLKDSTLEKLADKGNGNYAYIDTLAEAKKTLVEQMNGTLHTIAKDVKLQVEFNPTQVRGYRLIGYENRVLAKEDFNDDKKDAGEIGAGHTVTALYEVVPASRALPNARPAVDELKYQPKVTSAAPTARPEQRPSAPRLVNSDQAAISTAKSAISPELLTLKIRYKKPDGDVSAKLEFPLTDRGQTWEKSSADFRWAAAMASFGMMLRDSPHKGRTTWNSTLELAHEGRGEDRTGYRAEAIALIERAQSLAPSR